MAALTEQQRDAVNSIDRNVLVSAGAGSGKTHVLVERYVELLRRVPDLSVSNMVAVTYTRKAAAEMRTRLKAKFQNLLQNADDQERVRWTECYTEIDGARIVTIHSLCESILKAFPVDAGIDPQFEIVDDVGQSELLRKSIDHAFREVIDENSEEIELLLQQNIEELREWIRVALKSSTQFKEAVSAIGELNEQRFAAFARERLAEFQQRSMDTVINNPAWGKSFAYVEQNPWKDPASELERLRALMVELGNDIQRLDLDHQTRWSKFSEIASIKVGRYGPKNGEANDLKTEMKTVQSFVEDLSKKVPVDLNDEDYKAFRLILLFIRLANRAVSNYEFEKRSLLKLDYNDLIESAVSALSILNSPAQEHFHQTVRAILVDEFQDTNAKQAQLIRLLASSQTNLFLIGDDKQSIYKFQGADVATFNAWKNEFASTAAESIMSLSCSFRSHPSVVEFINAMFENVMADSTNDIFKARFEALSAARNEPHESERVRVVVLPEFSDQGEPLKAADLKQIEANAVAGWILDSMEGKAVVSEKSGGTRPIQFGDFAVLVQRNQDFTELEIALASQKIPYVTLGGRGFLERQEIYDIQNLLSFLSYPQDSHALIGILRSPMFGITDDMLHLIGANNLNDKSLWQKLKETVEQRKPGYESVASAKACLTNWIEDAGRLPVSDLLRKIIISTSYDVVLMTTPNGHQRSRNLWKIVSLATENENLSCSEFADSLRLMREFKVKQSDAPLDTGDVVKLMTIHSSKGLEFPAVALPVLGTSANSKAGKLKFHCSFGISLNTSRQVEDETKPSWYRLTNLLDNEMEMAEKRRLLYVAMTRARDHLALFMQPQPKSAQSFLNWIHQSLRFDPLADIKPEIRTINSANHAGRFVLQPATLPAHPCVTSVTEERNLDGTLSANPAGAAITDCRLIDAISPRQIEPPSAWTDWTRVTPATTGAELRATISGTYFHALMEHVATGCSGLSREQIQSIAFSQGDAVAHPTMLELLVNEGERLLNIFSGSKLDGMLKSARHHFHEMPYMIFEQESLSIRRPDLLIEDENGCWYIIDYKTDKFMMIQLDQQTAKHRAQLQEYVQDLKTLAGIEAQPFLYFAEYGLLHPCE